MGRPEIDVESYRTAERLLSHNRRKLMDPGRIRPHWIERRDRFWYRIDGPQGRRFVLVEPASATRAPAFDHRRLAASLAAASGQAVDATDLPFKNIDLPAGALEFDAFGERWRCSLDSYACAEVPGQPAPSLVEVPSPDRSRVAFRRGHDLWVRSLENGEEWALTSDGSAELGYGVQVDSGSTQVLMRNLGLPHLPPMVVWSPDSRRLVTQRTDQRGVCVSHLVESSPASGRPRLHSYRYAMPGDDVVPKAELVVLDADGGAAVWARSGPMVTGSRTPLKNGRLRWTKDGSAIFFLEQPRDVRTLWLKRLDTATGEVCTVIEETGETRVEPVQYAAHPAILHVFADGGEVIWYSQRDGWGHLYLYDAESGRLRNRITSGEWGVQQILHVDEEQRVVWFLASGLVADDPYRRQVCRAGLDGSGFTRLDRDDLDHAVTVPPNGAYFIDSRSTTDTAPVITCRAWDGSALLELERPDTSTLLATGWTAPEHFRAKAADGVTDVFGLLYRPHGFDPSRKYAIVDHPYPGPQKTRVVPTFEQEPGYSNAEALAALGFVVVAIDGRGTPGRSKAFHDLAKIGDVGHLDDHVSAIRELAETRPWMDLERVGIFGLSGGGYATVRALTEFPDFYKVGVAEAGNHDQRYYNAGWGETYDGLLDPEVYERSSNIGLADRLQGKLLLIHGEMDDNVYPHLTLRLVDRLIAADKDFEMLIVPGAEHHFVGYVHHVNRRLWDYLVRNLAGQEPPAGYRLTPVPLEAEIEAHADLLGG